MSYVQLAYLLYTPEQQDPPQGKIHSIKVLYDIGKFVFNMYIFYCVNISLQY